MTRRALSRDWPLAKKNPGCGGFSQDGKDINVLANGTWQAYHRSKILIGVSKTALVRVERCPMHRKVEGLIPGQGA